MEGLWAEQTGWNDEEDGNTEPERLALQRRGWAGLVQGSTFTFAVSGKKLVY